MPSPPWPIVHDCGFASSMTLAIVKHNPLQATLDHFNQQNPATRLVRITSWYPNFNGSHFGLPPSEIHKMTRLPPKIVWTIAYSHRPHSVHYGGWKRREVAVSQYGNWTIRRPPQHDGLPKPTHSGRYLNFESHHPVTAKYRMVDALFSRAEAIVTNEEQKQAEFSKIKQELLANDFPAPLIDNRLTRIEEWKTEESVRSLEDEAEDQRWQTTVLVPFVEGVTPLLQRILRPLNVRVVAKPRNWKWSLHQQLKDQTSRDNGPGVVYRLKCGDCEQSYIGETGCTACVLSIATKMVSTPPVRGILQGGQQVFSTILTYTAKHGCGTIFVAIESTCQEARVFRWPC